MTMYLTTKGPNIKGDVTSSNHKDWISIDSFRFGASRNISTQPGRTINRESTRPAISEVTLTKRMDKATTHLFQNALDGKVIEEVTLQLCTTSDSVSNYFELTLTDVIISSIEETAVNAAHSDTAGSKMGVNAEQQQKNLPVETLTLNFTKFQMRYIPYDEQHKQSDPSSAGYDLTQATTI
ncbi:MAG: hypothetical protein A3F17_04020 [Gammaproteobacteria bacterium RIFCSPHIGHO2_12_FULL_41_15]|nr:MAG: hypothetical protein A3F17_04020 [Gammaproteobacteria bacterium RIFCSPHIGHO2_12_FULL_41_15]